ncbi:hypothetical protein [Metapseudomonas resinovorans]|uniref:Uncharacterized protein n=1 Tax=Metapseudomonas resinovorans NBRC 106553 TaxID=1245471 RepID=S6AMM4_METRE|nr:hypothetical protein [Pseudomonas resinovorans]BAN50125.1 hypothetical protein PCA10_43930 [Pseudomonas resinovorans NBRC 106553]
MSEAKVLLLFLLLGFTLLEFLLPLRRMIDQATRPVRAWERWLLAGLHGLAVLIVLAAFGQGWIFALTAGLAVSSSWLLLNYCLSLGGPGNAMRFVVELLGNLSIILAVWLTSKGYWGEVVGYLNSALNAHNLVVLLAYMMVLQPASRLIVAMLQPWLTSISSRDGSLNNAGALIGYLERAMILTFVLLQQWEAVGFLLTAKSILRFNEVKGANHRALSEYILLGTLLSFSISIGVGLVALLILGQDIQTK